MKQIILLTAATLLNFGQVYATSADTLNNAPDSTIVMDDIVVTGIRTRVNLKNLPMSVSTINSQRIAKRFDQSLLPLISEEVPGLFITGRGVMGYGVAAGAAGGMSIRGVGGSPTSGVLMLIDGHPQYMGLMGHPLADSYQSMMAERVEVVRGPASILYGSNAMGGVINIITKKQQQEGVKTGARLMYGSYNTMNAEVNNSVRAGRFSSYVSLNYNRTDGHRENMDFEQYSGYVKLGYDISKHWQAFADLNLMNFNASNPGPVSAPITDNDADVTRGVASFSLENNYEHSSGAFKFFYNWGAHKINDGYTKGASPKDYLFHSRDNMLGVTWYQTYRLFRGNQTTLGVDYQRFGGQAWNQYPGKKEELIDKSLNDVAGYVNMQQTLAGRLTLNAGIRFDYNERVGSAWVPQVGVSFAAADFTTLKAIVSKGYRNPTLRDLYMFVPHNPDLKAESLMNYEVAVVQGFLDNTLQTELNLFYIKGDNSIVTEIVNGRPKYMNTGAIENYGVEFAARYRINAHLSVSANYSWLHMKNKVIASPEHKLYAGVDYSRRTWGFSTGLQYINTLYTQLKPTLQSDSFLLWNLRGYYRLSDFVELFVRGENLLAQRYEINAGYPMPAATVFVGATIRF